VTPSRGKPLARISTRPARCLICEEAFTRTRPGERVCGVACAIERAKRKAVAKAVAPMLPKRGRLTAQVHDKKRATRLCQKAFNALVRHQDRDRPCATCGTTADVKYDCGHWLTTGAHPELRFRRENASRQCSRYCNVGGSGRPVEHRAALVERWGQDAVDWLEGPHEMPHWTIDELDAMASAMRAQLRWEVRRGK